MSDPRRIAAAVLAVTIMALGLGRCPAVAEQVVPPRRGPFSLPLQGGKVLGFTSTVELGDSGAPGYVAVQIDVTSIGTFAADRRFTFVLESQPGGYSPPMNGLRYEIPVSVSQGDKTVRVVRYVPKWSVGVAYTLQVLEDNRRLEDYRTEFGMRLQPQRRAPSESMEIQNQIQWLVIQDGDRADASALPNWKGLLVASMDTTVVVQAVMDPRFLDGIGVGNLDRWQQTLNLAGRAELPTDWRGYSRHDAVVTSERTLEQLQTDADPRWGALRDWVLNGGVIVAYDAKSDRSTADLLDFAVATTRDNRGTVATVRKVSTLLGDASRLQGLSDRFPELAKQMNSSPDQRADAISSLPVGSGLVIGLQADSQADFADILTWRIIVELASYRRSPLVRRGVDPLIGDGRFSRWLIPGVAQPPVYTFIALLTCFVILVGPIAYRRTTKYGRGYLMFAIAPVLAMTTTLAMFGYGVIADGFGTVARVRQLTWVDGVSGDAAERVRSTYFAGVRPTTGLTFPASAEIFRYPENNEQSWEELNRASPSVLGTLRITDQAQVLGNEFLPARQQIQFVVRQPRRQVGRLVITPNSSPPSSSASPPLTVQSTFDFLLRDLVIRDQAGRYWFASQVPPQATTDCQELNLKEISKTLGTIYNRYRPISEVRQARRRSRYRNDTRDLINAANRQIFEATRTITDGTLEQWLQDHLQTNGEIPLSSFVSLADVSPDMIAVPGTELIESGRYVFGTLP